MRKTAFTEEQIAYTLRQAEACTPVPEVYRKLGISEQTFYRWKKKFAGMGWRSSAGCASCMARTASKQRYRLTFRLDLFSWEITRLPETLTALHFDFCEGIEYYSIGEVPRESLSLVKSLQTPYNAMGTDPLKFSGGDVENP